MEYQVLSIKWRPKLFDDVIGQTHITRSLQNAILQNKLGHAYLFAGTRGIGKTSMARIFAKALRCKNLQTDGNPCLACSSCQSMDQGAALDFIEIDGASNNGVEHVRQLIDNVQYLPVSGKYKVYVIDEVHMLSTNAFNALLKTIEEPPAHVIFIFATTDPEKLLGTVLSRCQRFDFRNADVDDLLNHLKKIAQQDGITYDNDGLLRQIALQGKGSVRDTLSLLDQVLSYSDDNHITEDGLISSLGLARLSAIKKILSAIFNSSAKECSEVYRILMRENVAVKNVAIAILDSLYEIIKEVDNPEKLQAAGLIDMDDLTDISSAELFWIYEVLAKDLGFSLSSIDPEKVTEIILQKVCLRRTFLEADKKPIIEGQSSNKDRDELKEPEVIAQPAKEENVAQPVVLSEEVALEEDIEEQPVEEVVCEEAIYNDENIVVVEEIKVPVADPKISNWERFISHMQENHPASASNLEQGNILEEIKLGEEALKVRLGFTRSSSVFLDYLKEADVYGRLVQKLSDFFEYTKDKIDLSLELIDEEVKEQINFQSKAEQEYQERMRSEEEQRQAIKNNTFIKQAENIFKAQVDRVVINNVEQ